MTEWDEFKATVTPIKSDVVPLGQDLARQRAAKAQRRYDTILTLVENNPDAAIRRLSQYSPERRDSIRTIARRYMEKFGPHRKNVGVLIEILAIVNQQMKSVGARPSQKEKGEMEMESRRLLKEKITGHPLEKLIGSTRISETKAQGNKTEWATRRKRRP